MKAPTYRYYTSDRGARLKSGPVEVVLKRNDLFRLEVVDGKPCVIKNGGAFTVNKKMLPELKARSEVAKVEKMAKRRLDFFDKKGLDLAKLFEKTLTAISNKYKGVDIKCDYKGQEVFFAFNTSYSNLPCMVTMLWRMNTNTITAAVTCSSDDQLEGWQGIPILQACFKQLRSALATKYGLTYSKVSKAKSTYGNVTLLGKPFSGRVHSFSANWYI